MKCPKCGYDNIEGANTCNLCKEVLAREGAKEGEVPSFSRPTWKTTPEKTATVIGSEISSQEAISFGWNTMWENLNVFIVSSIIMGAISLVGSMIQRMTDSFFGILIFLLFTYVNLAIGLGLAKITVEIVGGEKPVLGDLFGCFDRSVPYAIAVILIEFAVITAAGLCIAAIMAITKLMGMGLANIALAVMVGLIVISIILTFALRFYFVAYLMVDTDIDAFSAVKESYNLTKGRLWDLSMFLFWIAMVNILGALCLIIGLIFTVPATKIATAHFYRQLKNQAA